MRFTDRNFFFTITALLVSLPVFAQDNPFNKMAESNASREEALKLSRIDSLTALYYKNRKIVSYSSSFPVNNVSASGTDITTASLTEQAAFSYTFSISDAEYQRRLNQLESAIPLEYNRYVRQFIDLYGVRKRDLTSRMLTQANYYFPVFEEILDKNKLPLEFKYLSIVESALNPNAVSHCGATGLWQFMYATGKLYDLNINTCVDERKELYMSTQAACDYFKQMYNIYGDWLLVIASYNCGPGNVNKAIRKSGGKTNFWQIMNYLPKETRGYVPAFVAVAYMMNNAEKHFIYPSSEIEEKPLLACVNVSNEISFNQVATALDMPFDLVKAHNPTFKKGVIPARSSVPLYLPYEYAIRFIALGDSVYKIDPLNTVAVANPDTTSVDLAAGEDPQPKAAVIKTVAAKKSNPKYIRHTVKKGEGLYAIAKKYKCSAADIRRWNKLKSNSLRAGQRLMIIREEPVKAVLKPSPSSIVLQTSEQNAEAKRDSVMHTVRAGETLYSISKKYPGASVEQLKTLNNLSNGNDLRPGQVLIINN